MAKNIEAAVLLLKDNLLNGGKVLTAGNGGSASDAEHIVGELMKGFRLKRELTDLQKQDIRRLCPDETDEIAGNLQQAIPAISLVSGVALPTAFSNDLNGDYVFAQQLYGLGNKGDVLIAISTSGNSVNIINAAKVAKVKGVHIIGLTGRSGGELSGFTDICIKAPADDVAEIQEFHLPIYHCICSQIESELFGQGCK
ncbi:D-sedoheptulose 7-phosphate isomerase [Candidatus Desulfarcum epimagneticum]|uniref:D-sedoheptulose 7-phosphate isomerase n=1 Tax=uncultured Desulfobacteraceae bacterium TaxID=218296 RepID=A0A484HH33_9BACT|nr:D-sedoheptulose 7-phosphate isomerase [uncultured Desulfobacteraceae bacterium]